MNPAVQLFWYRVLTGLTPRSSAAHATWRDKKHRLRALLARRERAAFWDRRIAAVLACSDTEKLPRVADAGKVIGRDQIMHNGVKIALGTYYTPHMRRLLAVSRGVHEPQEERVFAEVLPRLPAGAVMLELGAYWAFYSLWFQQAVRNGRNILVEPDGANLNAGRLNFVLNNFTGEFFQGGVGERYSTHPYDAPTVSVDWLAEKFSLERVHLLHSDIQGFELAMLHGADRMLRERRVDYIFISTHGEALHQQCRRELVARDYHIFAEHTLAESYSVDGLLAARRRELPGVDHVPIAKKQ